MTLREQVEEFHRAFDQPIAATPTVPSDEVVRLRLRLVFEEAFELLEASMDLSFGGSRFFASRAREDLAFLLADTASVPPIPARVDMVEVADALADLDYVVEGARLTFGIDGAPVAAEVHRSNMAKLGADGKPIKRTDGKVVKPDGWTPPDVRACLVAMGWTPPAGTP